MPDLNWHPWALTALWAIGALVAAAVACRVGFSLAHRFTRDKPLWNVAVDFAEEPVRLLVSALALQGILQAAPDGLPWMGGTRHFTLLLVIGSVTWLGMRLVAAATRMVALAYPSDAADNLNARRIQTQARVLGRTLALLLILFGLASALMTFPAVRQIGAGLLASAGLAGLVVGFAAKPLLGNILAGLQIALTQPIRIDDVVIVDGEFGRVEEITGSYVVTRIWDERRQIVPLQWFIENPFQNWTRSSAQLLGAVFLWVDYATPLEPLRSEFRRLCEADANWDRRVCGLQVTEASERAIQLRLLVSAVDSGALWDLRCAVREGMIRYIAENHPGCLPRLRTESASDVSALRAGRDEPEAPVPGKQGG
jgi:small-conductance mechanosensitive channel